MKEMEKFARNKGMKIITLDTSPDNIEALIFYLRTDLEYAVTEIN